MYWSGKGNDLRNTQTRELDLTGVTAASLSLKSRFDIETDYDYLYAEASIDGGATWTYLDGTVDGAPFAARRHRTTRPSPARPAENGST